MREVLRELMPRLEAILYDLKCGYELEPEDKELVDMIVDWMEEHGNA